MTPEPGEKGFFGFQVACGPGCLLVILGLAALILILAVPERASCHLGIREKP